MQYRRMKDGTAKTIALTMAMAVYTAMEGFRRRYLDNAQIHELVPILCNALYTAYYCDRHRAKDWYCQMEYLGTYQLLPNYWEAPVLIIDSVSMGSVRDTELLDQLGLYTKIYALFVRNAMEDFHCRYLNDVQMRELNPIIRNTIYTVLYCMVNHEDPRCELWLNETEKAIPDDWPEPKLLFEKPRGGKAIQLKKYFQQYYLGKLDK